jgi:hypothetical protein
MSARTEYRLVLLDTSGEHRPVAEFVSSQPFHPVHVGDRFDDIGWNRLDGVGVIASPREPIRYIVHSIKHLVVEKDGTLEVSYCLNLQPHHGPSSPVWG